MGIRCISDAIVSCALEVAKEVLNSLPVSQTWVGVESSKISNSVGNACSVNNNQYLE